MNRKKDKKMAALIRDFSGYEGSKKSYCERHQIKPHVFDYYRKKLKGSIDDQEDNDNCPKFLPLCIKESSMMEQIELHYPNGNHLCLPLTIPKQLLCELIQLSLAKTGKDV